MNDIYHWIGLIVFWGIVAAMTAVVLINLFYLCRKLYKKSKLWFYLDWYHLDSRFRKRKKCDLIRGEFIFYYERKLINGSIKHPYKERILKTFQDILTALPEVKKEYDNYVIAHNG